MTYRNHAGKTPEQDCVPLTSPSAVGERAATAELASVFDRIPRGCSVGANPALTQSLTNFPQGANHDAADAVASTLGDALAGVSIQEVEARALTAEQSACEVHHHFGPGVYIREVAIKAGTFAVGHHQNFEHVNVMLKGRVRMFGQEGSTIELAAPQLFVGRPGRKVGLVLEDMVWQNIYATNERDIEKLEAHFLSKSDDWRRAESKRLAAAAAQHEEDRDDFALVLAQSGFTRELADAQSEFLGDQIDMPIGAWAFKVGPSAIHGRGVLATADIPPGAVIGPGRISGRRTPLGRFTNHSARPNARFVLGASGDITLISTAAIQGCRGGMDGEEITIDYRAALALSGVITRKEMPA